MQKGENEMAEKVEQRGASPENEDAEAANEGTKEGDPVRVHSEFAEPSRPGGYDGTRLPISPDGPAKPPGDSPDDAELARLVRRALKSDGRTAHCDILVSVRAGVAELDGSVQLEFERILVVALAEAVPGILNVADNLKVETY